jgi:hypothetical protein
MACLHFPPTAPSRKQQELALLNAHDGGINRPTASSTRGAATWLAAGMTIEEIQISIAIDVGRLGARPTEAQQLQVAHRRDKLQLQIDRFAQSAGTFLGHTFDGDDIADSYMDENVVEDDYSDQGDGVPVASSFSFQPEASFIPLPSNLGIDRCNEFGLTDLVGQEICLREGQANDALHAIRVNLAHKAVIFRKTVRVAKSQVTTTRAWTQVRSVENVISYNARIYSKCRKQLYKLGADQLLEKYRKLEKGDLKASTAIADPNARGQRNSTLPWFWSLDVKADTCSSDWMTECEWTCSAKDNATLESDMTFVQFTVSIGFAAKRCGIVGMKKSYWSVMKWTGPCHILVTKHSSG